jgi:hypothetical protein
MSGQVVARPRSRHECAPGWTEGDTDSLTGGTVMHPPSQFSHPAGTVWGCECGLVWVALPPRAPNWPGDVTWRREHWWERRRRTRNDHSVREEKP